MKAQDLSRLGNIDQRAITPPPAKGQQVAPARLKAQKVRPAQRSLHEANGLACRLIQSDAEILAVDRHRLAIIGPSYTADWIRNRERCGHLARVEIDEIHL